MLPSLSALDLHASRGSADVGVLASGSTTPDHDYATAIFQGFRITISQNYVKETRRYRFVVYMTTKTNINGLTAQQIEEKQAQLMVVVGNIEDIMNRIDTDWETRRSDSGEESKLAQAVNGNIEPLYIEAYSGSRPDVVIHDVVISPIDVQGGGHSLYDAALKTETRVQSVVYNNGVTTIQFGAPYSAGHDATNNLEDHDMEDEENDD